MINGYELLCKVVISITQIKSTFEFDFKNIFFNIWFQNNWSFKINNLFLKIKLIILFINSLFTLITSKYLLAYSFKLTLCIAIGNEKLFNNSIE